MELTTKTIVIYGKMRQGKSLLAGIMAANDWRKRIYSNMEIYDKTTGESILTRHLKNIDDIKKIRFSYTPGVILIDEAGINLNSKDGFSDMSRLLHEVLFYSGKLNCSMIVTAQRYNSVDINFREMSDLIIEMHKVGRHREGYPTFRATRLKQYGVKLEHAGEYYIDSIGLMDNIGISYDTLEKSKIQKKEKKKDKKQ